MVGLARSPGAGWHVELVSLVTPGQIEITAAVVTYTDDRPPWIWFPFRDGDPKAAAGLNDREALIAGEHTVAVVDVVARKELRSRRIRTRNKNILIARGGNVPISGVRVSKQSTAIRWISWPISTTPYATDGNRVSSAVRKQAGIRLMRGGNSR